MRVLIASDKFKGSLTSVEVCEAIKDGVLEVLPKASCEVVPLADGGEGTLAMVRELLGLEMREVTVQDPLFRAIKASYGIKGDDAYIEMATASGFELLNDHERSATETSSVGTGELIRASMEHGAKNIYLFVGGSATNDGGIGLASALGFTFLDKYGKPVSPTGSGLLSIASIEKSHRDRIATIHLITDVKNPLLGPNGASYQYGPQKGATEEDVKRLDEGLAHLANLVQQQSGIDVTEIPGSGAAGGLALSIVGLMKGAIQNGIETVLHLVNFEERLNETDLVITGEGKIDEQTLQGKVVYGVANMAKKGKVPAVAVCGISELNEAQRRLLHIDSILPLKTDHLSTEYCLNNAAGLIRLRVADFLENSTS